VPSALILYQYFHPDDVVSAVHLTELAEGLQRRGWHVTALPSNRSCRNGESGYPSQSIHEGIQIHRIWRPAFPQSKNWGRLINCVWMLSMWSLSAIRYRPDVVIIGTDPILSPAVAIPWKLVRRKTRTVHWCFDLYPEAAVADGILNPGKKLRFFQAIMKAAYKRFNLIADLGSCMRTRLSFYQNSAKAATITPWALAEPPQPLEVDREERKAIFGNARLALMYSGNFGRAHSYEPMLSIARALKDANAHFAFSIRGNCVEQVLAAVNEEDRNISFEPFARQEHLLARLSAADIHVLSLRPEWTGMVVPSKFFGALAAGRPVLFIGTEDSYVAQMIRWHGLGWVCPPGGESSVAAELCKLAEHPERIEHLKRHCHRIYNTHFSRNVCLDRFDQELRSLLPSNGQKPTERSMEPSISSKLTPNPN